jgi:hypothetical protein
MDAGHWIGSYPASDPDLSGRQLEQSGQGTQGSGLASAVRTE